MGGVVARAAVGARRVELRSERDEARRGGASAGEPAVEIRLLSDARLLAGARELVASVAKRLGFDDHGCGRIALAVDEALCNVIKHGYGGRADGPMWVRLWPIEGAGTGTGAGSGAGAGEEPVGLRIEVLDEAPAIDPSEIRGRELSDVRPGGLGVLIMREVMDEVVHERRSSDGPGMRLTMTVKRRSGSAGGERGKEVAG